MTGFAALYRSYGLFGSILPGLWTRIVAACDDPDRSAQASVQFGDSVRREMPWTAVSQVGKLHDMSTEHIEAHHRGMVRLLDQERVHACLGVDVIVRDREGGTFNRRKRAKAGRLDPCQSRRRDGPA
jgi:hypothetical protein